MSPGFYQREIEAETWRRFERLIGREIEVDERNLSRHSLRRNADGSQTLVVNLAVKIREITMTVSLSPAPSPSDVECVSTWEKDRGEG